MDDAIVCAVQIEYNYNCSYRRLHYEHAHIAHCSGGDSFKKFVNDYRNISLLIIDEWLHRPVSPEQSNDIFEIIEARYQAGSTVFITQFEKAGWYDKFGESVVTDAILDRVVHNSYELLIHGDISMRERYGLK